MRRALEHARRGIGRTTPNPVVGACVVTPEGRRRRRRLPRARGRAARRGVRARGSGRARPRRHAVLHARAVRRIPAAPGPCTERIIAAGIARVVAAMEDPFPLVQGRGFAALRQHGIVVEAGVARDEAVRLNQPFLTSIREKRPFVILKAATSLDGRMAAAPGERTQLTSGAVGPPRALPARAGGCDCDWLRHAARRRSAADRAPGLPRTAVDARRVRPRVARVAHRAPLFNARGGTSDNSDVAGGQKPARGPRARARGRRGNGDRGRRSEPDRGRSGAERPRYPERAARRAVRPCTRPRGRKTSSTTCSCMWRR